MQNFFIFSLLFGCDVARRKGKKSETGKKQKKRKKNCQKKQKVAGPQNKSYYLFL